MTLRRSLVFAASLAATLGGLAGTSAANHSRYEQLSTGQINGNGSFGAILRGFSADGSRTFFTTDERLVPGDTDDAQDVYEHSAGTTRRVSTGPINGNGAFDADFSRTSADGKRVFFVTNEPLVPGDTDTAADIYVRTGGITSRVSAGQINGNGAFDAVLRRISTDGKRVFFETDEPLVPADDDSFTDVYERSAGTTKRISTGPINGNGAFDATFDGASSDGSRVFFHTSEKLVSGDTDSSDDIYARTGGLTARVSAGQIHGNGPFDATFEGASKDGSVVFLITNERLVSADTDTSTDVYRRASGTTSRISTGQINGNGAFTPFFEDVSADGKQVLFETFESLVPGDSDANLDLYKRASGTTTRISAGKINGNGDFGAFFGGASADLNRIFFLTFEHLVPGDGDSVLDVYERSAGATSLISLGNAGFSSDFTGTSMDGSAVFFQTVDTVLPSDRDTESDAYGAYLAP